MAELTLQLVVDPATGRQHLVASLRRDEDALPQEHEALHRALVERLLDAPAGSDGAVGGAAGWQWERVAPRAAAEQAAAAAGDGSAVEKAAAEEPPAAAESLEQRHG